MAQEIILTTLTKDELATLFQDVVRKELHLLGTKETIIPDEYLTEKEASKFLKVSKVTLKKWRDEGRIKFYRIGSRIRYKESELLEALQQNHLKRKNR